MTSFQSFAKLCSEVEGISSSLQKVEVISTYLSPLGDEDLRIAVDFLTGDVLARSKNELGVGPSILYEALFKASGQSLESISKLLRSTGDPGLVAFQALEQRRPLTLTFFGEREALTLLDVYNRFLAIGKATGKGSQDTRIKNLQYLFSEASPLEGQYIARMVVEDMRIGVGDGLVRDAIAKAFNQDADLVERGYNITNDLAFVASYAKAGQLHDIDVVISRPIKMMLASIGESIRSSLNEGATVVEWKFDGARVQIHKDGQKVRLFSRRLEDVTSSLPEIVDVVTAHVSADTAILDGEAVAMGEDGRPRPFQDLLRRFRRKYHVASIAQKIPMKLNLFDIVFLNGKSLLDQPLTKRRELLVGFVDPDILADQTICDDPLIVEEIYSKALAAGHEGIMLKKPESFYTPGKRGKNWLKIKPVMEALDLVVIGARWGEGKRAKLLGSFQLACLDEMTGKLEEIGWVATGINDEMLAELSELFSELITVQEAMEVKIRPQVIFEVGYEEIQRSPNYSSGYALRFPRLIAVRDDKSVDETDTLTRITDIYKLQRGRSKR